MATVLLMKPLIEVRAGIGFIFLPKNRKEVQILCVIFKESQSGSIVANASVVWTFYQFVFLWYRFKAMYRQNATLISVWNIVLIMENVKKYGERRWQNETIKL